jgi:hypothetical protein
LIAQSTSGPRFARIFTKQQMMLEQKLKEAQAYADWASNELSLHPIQVEQGQDTTPVKTAFNQIIVFNINYLPQCESRFLAFAVFHEMGHIYSDQRQLLGKIKAPHITTNTCLR